jgi:hypothetical protein
MFMPWPPPDYGCGLGDWDLSMQSLMPFDAASRSVMGSIGCGGPGNFGKVFVAQRESARQIEIARDVGFAVLNTVRGIRGTVRRTRDNG